MEKAEWTPHDKVNKEFTILLEMLKALPKVVSVPLLAQAKILELAQIAATKTILKVLNEHIDSVRLDVLAQKFDLDATKREKQDLQDELDKM